MKRTAGSVVEGYDRESSNRKKQSVPYTNLGAGLLVQTQQDQTALQFNGVGRYSCLKTIY